MKKFSAVLFSGMFFLVLATGISHAIPYTDVQVLNQTLGGGIYSYTYTHDTPADFEVPYDTVNEATLTIKARDVSGFLGLGDDLVWVEWVLQGALNTESRRLEWSWSRGFYYVVDDPNSVTTFNLDNFLDVFSFGWNNGDPLHVTVAGLECDSLTLVNSTFFLDYDNGTAPNAPVPEPATLILLGTGLLGAAGLHRRNRK